MRTAGHALLWAASFKRRDDAWAGSAGEIARSALGSLGIDPDAGGDGETASHGEVLAMIIREWRQHADRLGSNNRWRAYWYRGCVHRANKWLRYLGVSRVFGRGVDA